MDLAADFAVPLPMRMIAEMLGIPVAHWPRYKRWSDLILKLANTLSREEAARTVQEYAAVQAVTGEGDDKRARWYIERARCRLDGTPHEDNRWR